MSDWCRLEAHLSFLTLLATYLCTILMLASVYTIFYGSYSGRRRFQEQKRNYTGHLLHSVASPARRRAMLPYFNSIHPTSECFAENNQVLEHLDPTKHALFDGGRNYKMLLRLAPSIQTRVYYNKQTIFTEDAHGDKIVFLVSGIAAASCGTGAQFWQFTAGDAFGFETVCGDKKTGFMEIRAQSECRVLEVCVSRSPDWTETTENLGDGVWESWKSVSAALVELASNAAAGTTDQPGV